VRLARWFEQAADGSDGFLGWAALVEDVLDSR
jgi:hypothetical protein